MFVFHILQDLYCVRSDLGNLLKALGRLEEAKVRLNMSALTRNGLFCCAVDHTPLSETLPFLWEGVFPPSPKSHLHSFKSVLSLLVSIHNFSLYHSSPGIEIEQSVPALNVIHPSLSLCLSLSFTYKGKPPFPVHSLF